jgi:hypothetical protein
MKFNVCNYNRLYYYTILFFYRNETTINFPVKLFNKNVKFFLLTNQWVKPTILMLNEKSDNLPSLISYSYKLNTTQSLNKFTLYTTYSFSNYNRIGFRSISKFYTKNSYFNRLVYWVNYCNFIYNFEKNLSTYLHLYFINHTFSLFSNSLLRFCTQKPSNSKTLLTHNFRHL